MFLFGCFIYVVVLTVVFTLVFNRKKWGDPNERLANGFCYSLLIVFLWFIIGDTLLYTKEVPYVEVTSKYEIAAMKDSSGTKGIGSIFFVNVGPGLSINYIQKNSDGSLTPKSIRSTGDIKIYEGSYKPQIVQKTIRNGCNATVARRMFVGPCKDGGYEHSWYEFYVPEGTVVTSFEVDLE